MRQLLRIPRQSWVFSGQGSIYLHMWARAGLATLSQVIVMLSIDQVHRFDPLFGVEAGAIKWATNHEANELHVGRVHLLRQKELG